MKLLVLSNGHGEDIIAVRILEQLQSITNNLELTALPLVGEGYAYSKLKIPIIGKVKQMPSGGFIYMDSNPLWDDIRGGLIQLTISQLQIVRQWGKQGGFILAVGDIVPLLFAWLSGANYAFVGTAKSEYYLRNETDWLTTTSWLERRLGSVYLPWERWLMSRDRCLAIFPRDSLTTETLQQKEIRAIDLGNPMMDGLPENSEIGRFGEDGKLAILLLPGSRLPEALRNWQQIMATVTTIIETLTRNRLEFYAAIAPALDLKLFKTALINSGWRVNSCRDNALVLSIEDKAILYLTQNSYAECLQLSDLAIAMAGTATEQFVGLGKPVITMPGTGPQFTWAFAEAQSRLLGSSVILVENPQQVVEAMRSIFDSPEQLPEIALNGKRRMGDSGAAKRIALHLQQTLLNKLNDEG
jgi:uncharacterized protein (TIGR03492 family)